jgi:hypothetical protein
MDGTWNREKRKQSERALGLQNHTDGTTRKSRHERNILSLKSGRKTFGEQNLTEMDQGPNARFL